MTALGHMQCLDCPLAATVELYMDPECCQHCSLLVSMTEEKIYEMFMFAKSKSNKIVLVACTYLADVIAGIEKCLCS
jgi:hypothetical protein